MSGAVEGASIVLAEKRKDLGSEPWKVKVTDGHPAALYCTLQYAVLIHWMQCTCYEQMAVQSGRGKTKTDELIEQVNKETNKWQSLLGQRELEGIFSYSRERLAEALEYAANNKYGEYIPYMSTVLLVICGCQCRHYLYLCKVCGHVLHVMVRS